MKELIALFIISGLLLLAFITFLVLALAKRKNSFLLVAGLVFFAFVGMGGWTAYTFLHTSYNKVIALSFKERSGDEIYASLFGRPETACVQIIASQDPVLPPVDNSLQLYFKTCPQEMDRILRERDYAMQKFPAARIKGFIPHDDGIGRYWFAPPVFGDSVLEFEYAPGNSAYQSTIWINRDSTLAFFRDFTN